MVRIIEAVSEQQIVTAAALFREYAAWLGVDLGFQDFETELATLPGAYRPPGGVLLLAVDDETAVGCVAVRPLDTPGVAELKRLYVSEAARGAGLGRELTVAALDAARASGYERIRLDTLPVMGSAQHLYESLGFRPIDPYRHNPIPGAMYLELDLRAPGDDAEPSRYFELGMDSLRAIGGWSASCAERALPVFRSHAPGDPRPQEAIEGIREFEAGGRRTAALRTLALAAHAAAREVGDPAAAAAARAAGTAAASAYTHPLADVHQTKHVIGAAAYTALAIELDRGGDVVSAQDEVRRAIAEAPDAAREVLLHMPARSPGTSRLDTLLYELDAGLRAREPVNDA